MRRKVSTPEYEAKVLEALSNVENPVTVQFIADQCELGWGTARAVLYDLTLQGRIKMQQTTSTPFFCLERGEEEKKSEENGNNQK